MATIKLPRGVRSEPPQRTLATSRPFAQMIPMPPEPEAEPLIPTIRPGFKRRFLVCRSRGGLQRWGIRDAVAYFSRGGRNEYRYAVVYQWDADLAPLIVTLANPSTATHEILDPTLAGMVSRAQEWGFGSLIVTNVFAYRATDPDDMRLQRDPAGPLNRRMLRHVFRYARQHDGRLLAGWGNIGGHQQAELDVIQLAHDEGLQLYALAVNANGSPRHPLYVSHDTKPRAWKPRRRA